MAMQKASNLFPYPVLTATGISSTQTSVVTDMMNKDNPGYTFIWTGTLAGSFTIQSSVDYVPNNNGNNSPPIAAGTWNTLPGITGTALGSPDSGVIELNEITQRYYRAIFTYSSGTGNLTIYATAKGI